MKAIIREVLPILNKLEDVEKAEAQMALIVISVMFAIVLCGQVNFGQNNLKQ